VLASIPLLASNVQPLEVLLLRALLPFVVASLFPFVVASPDLSGRGNLRDCGACSEAQARNLAPRNNKRLLVKKSGDLGLTRSHRQVYQWATALAPIARYSGVWWAIISCGIMRPTVPLYAKFQQPYWSVNASSYSSPKSTGQTPTFFH